MFSSPAFAEPESIGSQEFGAANRHTIEELRVMSTAEIEALDKKLSEALVFYYDRQFGKALPIFTEIVSRVETMDIMFWIGTSAMELGKPDMAIDNFKRMLKENPTLHRVRLELATAYFSMGRYDEARTELNVVKAAPDLPDPVSANIERLLAAIDEASMKNHLNVRLSTGFMWDNNINSGPRKRDYAVVGGTLTPGEEMAEIKDEAVVFNMSANLVHDIGNSNDWLWNSSGVVTSKFYDHEQFDMWSVGLNTGPWLASHKDIFKLPMGIIYQEYGGKPLSFTRYLNPSYEYHFSGSLSLQGQYRHENERFDDAANASLNNNSNHFIISPTFFLDDRRHIITASAGYTDHDADLNIHTYTGPSFSISYFSSFFSNTEVLVQYQLENRNYDGVPLLASENREDQGQTYSTVVSQQLSTRFFLTLAAAHTSNSSNIPIYEYKKTTVTLSLQANFSLKF